MPTCVPIPSAYVINLDSTPKRWCQFAERNGHLNVTRFPGADGASLDRMALLQAGYIAEDLSWPPGTLGCAISHIRLWELAVRESRPLTILEDDIAVAHHFEPAAAVTLSALPADWDFVKWGWLINPAFAWLDVGISRVTLHGYGAPAYQDKESIKAFQNTETTSVPVRMLHSFGLHAYSISPKGARCALDYCLPLRNRMITFPDAGITTTATGVDVLLCGVYPQMQAFVALPSLVIVADEEGSVRKAIDAA
jgi:GR25 family glycosyltransferase involved in LPS biosynthesis